ncbi:hypothetical protein O1611_g4064 [Lasiodiplodia mahajangana]|uniref:Uncharacterized protein n=1 Tax=Lasiodiplodia mahajangana TaxID=1108764 RepID=A0ACC2JQ20_9PEZI|nr:hypothetical protein O1611_g4064 [Lasiodiplodia mahajangana]
MLRYLWLDYPLPARDAVSVAMSEAATSARAASYQPSISVLLAIIDIGETTPEADDQSLGNRALATNDAAQVYS